jgi:hypothetical protein
MGLDKIVVMVLVALSLAALVYLQLRSRKKE